MGDGNWCMQVAVLGSISAYVFALFFSGTASKLRGAKLHASEQSQERWLSAWVASKSRESVATQLNVSLWFCRCHAGQLWNWMR